MRFEKMRVEVHLTEEQLTKLALDFLEYLAGINLYNTVYRHPEASPESILKYEIMRYLLDQGYFYPPSRVVPTSTEIYINGVLMSKEEFALSILAKLKDISAFDFARYLWEEAVEEWKHAE